MKKIYSTVAQIAYLLPMMGGLYLTACDSAQLRTTQKQQVTNRQKDFQKEERETQQKAKMFDLKKEEAKKREATVLHRAAEAVKEADIRRLEAIQRKEKKAEMKAREARVKAEEEAEQRAFFEALRKVFLQSDSPFF